MPPVPSEKSYPDVVVMQSRQDWDGNNVAGLLNSSPQRRILAQRMPHAIVFIFLPPPPIMAAELKEQLEFSILNQKTSPSSGTRSAVRARSQLRWLVAYCAQVCFGVRRPLEAALGSFDARLGCHQPASPRD